MAEARYAEAKKLLESGKKKSSKGLFNWSPDYNEAADDYEKAATMLRQMNRVPEARDAFVKASETHDKAGNLLLSARSLENAAQMLQDNKAASIPEIVDLYAKAARLYARDNKSMQQSQLLQRASRLLIDAGQAEKASALVEDAISALEDDDKYFLTTDLYRALVLSQIRAGDLTAAVKSLKKQRVGLQKTNNADLAAKGGLEIVVLALALNDTVLADRELQEASSGFGFPGSKEQSLAGELLAAFDSADAEYLADVAKNVHFTFLNPDVSRMVKKLKIGPGAVKRVPATAAAAASSPAGVSAPPPPAEDDDEDIR
jgi:tetratricopeptide (TPR) repeat protein